jgi:hypothetical protein
MPLASLFEGDSGRSFRHGMPPGVQPTLRESPRSQDRGQPRHSLVIVQPMRWAEGLSRGRLWTGSRHDGAKPMIARHTLAVLRSRA